METDYNPTELDCCDCPHDLAPWRGCDCQCHKAAAQMLDETPDPEPIVCPECGYERGPDEWTNLNGHCDDCEWSA